MNRKSEIFEQVLTSPFDNDTFVGFVKEFLNNLSLIFPMAFMCDLSSAKLREFVLKENKIDYLEAFPERDNENKRVFKSAKMSVCILGSTKTHVKEDVLFPMRIR